MLFIEAFSAIIQSIHSRLVRHKRRVLFIAEHFPITDSQAEGRIRVHRLAVDCEPSLSDLLARARLYALNLLFEPRAQFACYRLDVAREDYHRVVGLCERVSGAFYQRL